MEGSKTWAVATLLACLIVGSVTKTVPRMPNQRTSSEGNDDDMDPKTFDVQKAEGRGAACAQALIERNMQMARVAAAGGGRCELDPNDDIMQRVRDLCDEPRKAKPCGFLGIKNTSRDDDSDATDNEEPTSDATPNTRRKRLVENNKVWNKGIVPYAVNDLSSSESVKRAMATFERFTCFRFVEHYAGIENDLGLGHTAFLSFVNHGGCWSMLGRSYGGQEISCCGGETCLHELGHALGAHHEHQNPRGEGIIKLQVENVQNEYRHNYAVETGGFSTGYDFNSLMHYEPWGFTNGNGDTIKYLFTDLPTGTEWFYLMQELSLVTNCAGEHCSDSPLQCVNDGFLTLVDGACGCVCPEGLDPDTGCATVLGQPEANDVPEQRAQWTAHTQWPAGQYALPAPASGCPDDQFNAGTITESGAPRLECKDNDVNGCPYWGWSGCVNNPGFMYPTCPVTCDRCHEFGSHQSDMPYLKGSATENGVTHEFCTKDSAGSGDKWPVGSYCIYRQGGACPEGFQAGSAAFSDVTHSDIVNGQSGSVPDGEFTESSTKFEFCCMNYGFSQDEIVLPTGGPFSLVKLGDNCQNVRGMNVYEGNFAIRSNSPIVTSGKQPFYTKDSGFQTYGLNVCYYQPEHMDCGSAIALTKDNPTASFSGTSGPDRLCNWFITAPEGDRVVLHFDSFNVECVDSLSLRFMRPGQPGKYICGDSYRKSTTSIFNTMAVTYQTKEIGNSNFEATVSLVSSDELCYNTADHGQTYAGKVNVTRGFRQCLPWAETGHCHHSPFRTDYIDENLEDNYCRTPHNMDALMPWCYYEAHDCKRDYCDVCGIERAYDTADDCVELAAQGYCTDPAAVEKCAVTCADSVVQFPVLPPANTVSCGAPGSVSDGDVISEVKDSYSVGDRVTFKCKTSSSTRDKRCLTTGQWSSLNYVCEQCDDGWTLHEGNCYKFSADQIKYWEAKTACENLDAQLATSKSAEENKFLMELDTWNGLWLAATDDQAEGTWVWADGEQVQGYSNWKPGEPDDYYNEDCMYMNNVGQWEDKWCTNDWKNYVCVKPSHGEPHCDDATAMCQNLYVNLPTVCESQAAFMGRMCRATCGLCEPATCAVPPAAPHTVLEDDVTSIIQGEHVSSHCEEADNVHYVSGDLMRGCGPDGELTGAPLVCEGREESVMKHREPDVDGDNAGSKWRDDTTYIQNTKYTRIKTPGKVVRWEYYSHKAGQVAFQVWRKTDSNSKFEFVGQNTYEVGVGRSSYKVASSAQITAEKNDVIAIYYGTPSGGIRYFKCNSDDYKWSFDKKTYRHENPVSLSDFKLGETMTFKQESRETCRMYNFYAVIEPSE